MLVNSTGSWTCHGLVSATISDAKSPITTGSLLISKNVSLNCMLLSLSHSGNVGVMVSYCGNLSFGDSGSCDEMLLYKPAACGNWELTSSVSQPCGENGVYGVSILSALSSVFLDESVMEKIYINLTKLEITI